MALQPADVKEINLKTNKLVLTDGRQYELSPEMRSLYENPEFAKVSKGVASEERDWMQNMEKVPFGGELYAVSKGLAESNFGLLKNLINKYALQPATAQLSKSDMGTVDTIRAQKLGQSEVAEEAANKYPISTKIGQALAIASDFGLSLPKALSRSPTATGAAFGFSSAPAVYEDPEGAVKGTLMGAGLGYGLGKAQQGLSRVASQRGALRSFNQAAAEHPQAVNQARDQFRRIQGQKLGQASSDLRRGVSKNSLKTDQFVNRVFKVSDIAGSPEAKAVQGFIETVESGLPDKLDTNNITRIFDAVEGRIARATSQAEENLLKAYKSHLVERIPEGAAHQAVKDQVGEQVINMTRFDPKSEIGKAVNKRISDAVEKMSPEEFYSSLQNGELAPLLKEEIKQSYKDIFTSRGIPKKVNKRDFFTKIDDKAERVADQATQWMEKDFASVQKEASDLAQYVQKRVSSRIRNATGSPNPVTPEIPPTNQLNLPEAPIAPQTGAMAQRFEQPFEPFRQVRESFENVGGAGLLGKALGIPGAFAKAGIGAGVGLGKLAGEGALRGLTSPTARLSQLTRQAITTGGIPLLVESISGTYPSYDKGVLLDPLDRNDAVAEIENNPYIPLEEKALLQARINRGKSLEELTDFEEVK